jgi:hypothetical protein
MNHFDTMRSALQEAKQVQEAADTNATQLAWMLDGRLRRVNSAEALRRLKRELRSFDMTTGRWMK